MGAAAGPVCRGPRPHADAARAAAGPALSTGPVAGRSGGCCRPGMHPPVSARCLPASQDYRYINAEFRMEEGARVQGCLPPRRSLLHKSCLHARGSISRYIGIHVGWDVYERCVGTLPTTDAGDGVLGLLKKRLDEMKRARGVTGVSASQNLQVCWAGISRINGQMGGSPYERRVGLGTSQTSDSGDRGETRLGSQKYTARSEQGRRETVHARQGRGGARGAPGPARIRRQAAA